MEADEDDRKHLLTRKLWQNRCACLVISELIQRTAEEQGIIDAAKMERLCGMSYLVDLVGSSIHEAYTLLMNETPAR